MTCSVMGYKPQSLIRQSKMKTIQPAHVCTALAIVPLCKIGPGSPRDFWQKVHYIIVQTAFSKGGRKSHSMYTDVRQNVQIM